MLAQAFWSRNPALLALADSAAIWSPLMGKAKKPKNPIAAALAKMRARKLTPERRSEIARQAALARWRRAKGEPKT